MEKKITIFHSFEEAARADKEYYLSLSPQERLDILFELNRRWPKRSDGEAAERPARVYRVIELS